MIATYGEGKRKVLRETEYDRVTTVFELSSGRYSQWSSFRGDVGEQLLLTRVPSERRRTTCQP